MVGDLTKSEIEALLVTAPHAHLGCHAAGKTYIVPISFAFDGKRIIGYTHAGMKTTMMRENPDVCIQVEDVKSFGEWKSAIVWGRYEELHGSEAAVAAGYLIDRYGPIFADSPIANRRGRDITPPKIGGAVGEVIVYSIRLTEHSGRYERP